MKRALVFIVLFAGAAQAADPLPVISATGFGKATVGMDVDRLERVLNTKINYNQWLYHGCSAVTTKLLEPIGISFVIDTKVLTRINLEYYGTDPRPLETKTDAGVGLGSSEEDVLKAYAGRTRIEPTALDPTWHTIFVDEPDHKNAIVFETNGKTVKSIRAGAYPAVNSRNACE